MPLSDENNNCCIVVTCIFFYTYFLLHYFSTLNLFCFSPHSAYAMLASVIWPPNVGSVKPERKPTTELCCCHFHFFIFFLSPFPFHLFTFFYHSQIKYWHVCDLATTCCSSESDTDTIWMETLNNVL